MFAANRFLHGITNEHGITTFGIPFVRDSLQVANGITNKGHFITVNVNVNVNVISRTALIRNRVSRRVLHVSKITWGILYLFQEAQTH